MGYDPAYFNTHIAKWLQNEWLRKGGNIIEFGAQEFSGDEAESRKFIKQFLHAHNVDDKTISLVIDDRRPLSVSSVYDAVGIYYTALDVDSTRGSQYFDLNSSAPAENLRGVFDFVNNEGTIEHLINPINGFQVAHELLKVGGVARHSVPLTGWLHHGFVYPTPKFYAHLLGDNGYEMLEAKIMLTKSPVEIGDSRFRLVDEADRELTSDFVMSDSWIWLTYRKQTEANFKIPSDHLYSDIPDVEETKAALREQLVEDYRWYSSHRRIVRFTHGGAGRPRDGSGIGTSSVRASNRRSEGHSRG